MPEVLNGHTHGPLLSTAQARDKALAKIEAALAEMLAALVESGFTQYEASTVNLATRFSITNAIKERNRKG